jgi:hypothetical protein
VGAGDVADRPALDEAEAADRLALAFPALVVAEDVRELGGEHTGDQAAGGASDAAGIGVLKDGDFGRGLFCAEEGEEHRALVLRQVLGAPEDEVGLGASADAAEVEGGWEAGVVDSLIR